MTAPLTPIEFIARLRAVNWSDAGVYNRMRSRSLLMREHLRRAAWWLQRYPSDRWPFPDLAAAINPAVRADPVLVDQVEEITGGEFVVRAVCLDALHWYTLRSLPGVVLPDLPDPFEPLLVLLERGGGFTLISGYVDVGLALVPRWDVARHLSGEQIVELDSAVLDKIDNP
ncbi:hypothetical protein [Catellatospora tritici]|uniref:hypothetical protein n=1 Tax=Catellatospora tritici TaxID=2851566 RepID=UPI001C2DF0D9|nr:hypothetical protein [Catellatospora tritici]MBV1852020.1 hypothetical protein [Catellatospora tritici]